MPKKKEKAKVNIETKKINAKPNKKSKEDNYRNIESINYIIKKQSQMVTAFTEPLVIFIEIQKKAYKAAE